MFDVLISPDIHRDHFGIFFLPHNRHRPRLTSMANAINVPYK